MENKLTFVDIETGDNGLLPNFCDVRIIFMLVLLVELFAMVLTAAPSSVDFWEQLAFTSMLMQWIGLLNAAFLCASRRWLNKLPTRINVSLAFIQMMLVSLGFCLLVIAIKSWLLLDEETSPLGDYFLLRIMLISAAIYAVTLRYFYVQEQWKHYIQAHSKAEIQALKARIRPHFLFNSMNTIASLISFKPEKAERAVEDLSELFRASLREKNTNTLADELSLTRSYLDIEGLRLDHRLEVKWEVDSSLEDTEVPALCLQPIVENAIYHGIEPLPEGGQIMVTALREGDQLVISVKNPLGKAEISVHKGNHIAQENIKQRLHLVYGKKASFELNETKQDYTVVMRIPLEV